MVRFLFATHLRTCFRALRNYLQSRVLCYRFLLPCEKFVEQSDELFGSALVGERRESTDVSEQDAETFDVWSKVIISRLRERERKGYTFMSKSTREICESIIARILDQIF